MMRKYLILLIITMMAAGLFLTACEESENITEPENAKWSVFVTANPVESEHTHFITVMWIGSEEDYEEPTSLELEIGDDEVDLEKWQDIWIGEKNLTPGEKYNFKLEVNGETVVSTSQTIVYNADADFPEDYNPEETAYVEWTLEKDNEHQYASVYAYDLLDPEEDEEVTEEIDSSARSYQYPADVVSYHGIGTQYTLEISEMNDKYVDDVLVASAQADYQDYGNIKRDRGSREEMVKYVKHMLNLIMK
ncbi:hypothetical protein E0946_03780 [Candidatus Syntrophosphaera thermopropionivorans]|jgi:hypothetical protein|uniref:Uncharacterized protein n=1 Tax=Candidatus Syntrophosphaera thermopropionivorans TaxID=2593015 RepID=A0AC61QJD5_9BACT|nr:hypothetical protein E0946_03780 [Candidatus Syntrophosphaera thermopropionivorans]